MLIINLKRFYNSTWRREKLNTMVEVPDSIDMTTYSSFSNHYSKKNAGSYILYGICHHGGNMNFGHYISDV